MDLAPFARMDDPVVLPSKPITANNNRRRFNEDDDDEEEETQEESNLLSTNEIEEEKKQVEHPFVLPPQETFSNLFVPNEDDVPPSPSSTSPQKTTQQPPTSPLASSSYSQPNLSPRQLSPNSNNTKEPPSFTPKTTFEDQHNNNNEGITSPSTNTPSIHMRNKQTEPSVFWAEHREWLKSINKITFVSVDEPLQMARSLINPNPPFTYLIKTSIHLDGVRRRYSDFEILRVHLAAKFPGILLLALPEKKAMGKNDDFLLDRAKGLENFLQNVTENDYLRADSFLREFLTLQPSDWEAAKKRISSTVPPTTQTIGGTGDKYPFRPIQSPSSSSFNSSEERWRAAVHMCKLPDKFEEEISKAYEMLSRLENILKSLTNSATKCAQLNKSYAMSVKELHKLIASSTLNSLQSLHNPVEFWSDACNIEPVLMEELLVNALEKEMELVAEMKRMLDARKELVLAADYKLGVLHKYEDEREANEKTGQMDRAQRSGQKVQDAMKQVKQADYRLEMMTKALFLSGLGTFASTRIEGISRLMGRFAFGELRFGDLMKSVWLGLVASLRLDLTQIEKDAQNSMEGVRKQVPEKFRGMFTLSSYNNNDEEDDE